MARHDETSQQVGAVILREFEAKVCRRKRESEVDDVELRPVDGLWSEIRPRPVGVVGVHQGRTEGLQGGGGTRHGCGR